MLLLHKMFRRYGQLKPLLIKNKYYSTKKPIENVEIANIRNIGILAHIDAGKTTTTERMLYYSGLIQQMGEVHHGNTVTDYMSQERERGITITSAAITFHWRKHQFNLVDTPGHIDFTMEVEQTSNVLDGAVVVLDASAGVEAQTLTVWRQANRYKIPRIVFLNKMDRADACYKLCCESIEKKLEVPTLCLQLPIIENDKFIGIVDLITNEKIIYDMSKLNDYSRVNLTEKSDTMLWENAQSARAAMLDELSDFNDDFANTLINSESLDSVPVVDVVNALRKVTNTQQAVPVLMGSAYKNIGVQPLMDSVILYLPSPDQRNKQYKNFDNNLCARAFKVIHDKQRGTLIFFRIYNGEFIKGQKIYNIQQEKTEQSSKLYIAYADDFKEIESIKNGNIAVVTGLKYTNTGNLISNSFSAYQKAKQKILKSGKKIENEERYLNDLLGTGANIPEPVFFRSIEPPSLAYQNALENALNELQREDPSLRVTYNSETGQTVLAGMGELHLEIIKDRILKQYKIDADLGPLQIAYRESPISKVTDNLITETKIGSSKQFVHVKLSLIPTDSPIKEVMKLDKTPDAASNIAGIFPKHLLAVRQGIEIGLAHGPRINAQVVNTHIMLHYLEVGRGTSESKIAATVTQLVQKLLQSSGTNVLEPVMQLEIVTQENYLSTVMADLSRRRCIINNVTVRGNSKVVISEAPLSELLGYSTALRTLTSGTGTFTMEFSAYQKMSAMDEEKAISFVRGF